MRNSSHEPVQWARRSLGLGLVVLQRGVLAKVKTYSSSSSSSSFLVLLGFALAIVVAVAVAVARGRTYI